MTHPRNAGRLAPAGSMLAALHGDYPAFRFSSEAWPGRRRRYTAQRTDGQSGLHTIVTADLAELRQALTTHTAGPA